MEYAWARFSGLLRNPEQTLDEPMLMINTTYEYGDRIRERLRQKDYDVFKRRGLYAWMMMYEGNYKYIRHLKEDCIEELYDLAKDPEELTNLAADQDYKNKLSELRDRAVKEFKRKDGDFVDHLPKPRIVCK